MAKSMCRNSFFIRHTLGMMLLALTARGGLQWTPMPGGRSAPLTIGSGGKAGFTLLSPTATRIRFTNTLSDALAAENQIRLLGSGIALGDVDGDGLCDIYACALTRGNALDR